MYHVCSDMALVLASASPRRKQMLEGCGLSFSVAVADIDETPRRGEKVDDLVSRLAHSKALTVESQGAWVLAADTLVSVDGNILGKPSSRDEAKQMLETLSGRAHSVWGGVCLHHGDRKQTERFVVESEVCFRSLTDLEIEAYLQTEESSDKAGAYAIQGFAAGFVQSLRGSYTNVVGLPLAETLQALLGHAVIAPCST